MPRPRRDLSRVPGFRPPRRVRLADRLFMDAGITEDDAHTTEYEGQVFVTPSIYGKENDPIDLVQGGRPATDFPEADPHTQE